MLKIRLDFGVPARAKKEIKWGDDVLKFPRIVSFDGKIWEWMLYDKDSNNYVDYVFTFGETTAPFDLTVPSIEEMFRYQFDSFSSCQCGAIYDREFPNIHMFFCPLWSKI